MNRDVPRPRQLLLLIVAALLAVLLASARPAPAAFPGENGKIAFARADGIFVINADGSGQAQLTTSPPFPEQPAWSANGTKLAFSAVGDIYVVDSHGGGQTRLTDGPAWDSEPAWSPDGRLAFARRAGDGTFDVFVMESDGSGQTRLTTDPAYESNPAWSPDGKKIAFAGPGGISLISPDGTDLTQLTTDFGSEPSWSPDGTKIAFRASSGPFEPSRIHVMNADGSDKAPLSSSGALPFWSPDGTKIAFMDWDGLYVMNPDGSGRTRLTDGACCGSSPDWQPFHADADYTPPALALNGPSPLLLEAGTPYLEQGATAIDNVDGDLGAAIVISGAVDTLTPRVYTVTYTVADAAGNASTARRAVLVVAKPATVVNGKIAFTSSRDGNTDVYVMDPDGSDQTRLTTDPAVDADPAWSPDGTKLAFTSLRDGTPEVYVMNADGSGQTRLTTDSTTAWDSEPAWSPDGTTLAFSSGSFGWNQIYVMHADGGSPTRLTTDGGFRPAWSPDGTKIAFTGFPEAYGDIYVMNADGSEPRRLATAEAAFDSWAAWSPDGSKLAFASNRHGSYAVYVMNVDGSEQTRLTGSAFDVAPAWSPDGMTLAFTSDRDGNSDIYSLNADGSQTRLTSNAGADFAADWQRAPANGCGEVRGDGRLDTNTHTRFVFYNVRSDGSSAPSGEISFSDRAASPRLHFASTAIRTLVIAASHVTLRGSGIANGAPVDFVVEGDDGSPDRFSIRLSSGYAAVGAVAAGRGVNLKPC